jgi:hypothetical protein
MTHKSTLEKSTGRMVPVCFWNASIMRTCVRYGTNHLKHEYVSRLKGSIDTEKSNIMINNLLHV